MIRNMYKTYIGRYIFRKLNFRIGISLFCVFVLIGSLTNSRFYNLLEDGEKELLDIRVQRISDQFHGLLEQFKRETMALYPGNAQTSGAYEHFLKGSMPGSPKASLEESQYFSSLMSLLLNRNPAASSVLFYRVNDSKLFYKPRKATNRLMDQFNYRAFLADLPKSYQYPQVGNLTGLMKNEDQPVIYLVNPIFDYQSIHPNKAYGYFVICLDRDMLLELFDSEHEQETLNRLVIYQRDQVLFDSAPSLLIPEKNSPQFLEHAVAFSSNDLQLVGLKDKSVIHTKLSSITTFIVEILIAAWVVCILLIYGIQRMVNQRFKLLSRRFKRIQMDPFTQPIHLEGDDEFTELVERFDQMTLQLQQHINQVYVADIKRRNAEYYALKMQINPHFLYNTLESLRMQALLLGQRPLSEKLYNLGRLYRWILKSGVDTVSIQEEVQYTEHYLDLFMTGKSNPIELSIDTELDISRLTMLKFSLQPIVENALIHGDLDSQTHPWIHVLVTADDSRNELCIEIHNNGKGLPYEEQAKLNKILIHHDPLQELHMGLKNVHDRIRAFYGSPYGVEVLRINPEEGFGICMRLPLNQEGRNLHD